jgi:hypothetical protein
MAFIKRLVIKARRGNITKAYIDQAASIAGLPKTARRVQPNNISPTPTTYNPYSARGRPPSLQLIL